MSTVFVKSYNEPKIDIGEVMRYSGCRVADDAMRGLIDECIEESRDVFTYNICYSVFPIEFRDGEVKFPFMSSGSVSLIKNLSGCTEAVVFAATVGIGIDRLIARYGRVAPSKAVIFQAIGAERIESLCNTFSAEVTREYKEKGLCTRPRFSAGYGDFPLSAQRDIFRVLDCPRKIGLSLNESFMMSPSKSVTAIIGISEYENKCEDKRCESCLLNDCAYRGGIR